MRRLCALQITLVLVGWFYTSKVVLTNYPGAYSIAIDGPFVTEIACNAARNEDIAASQMFGVTIEFGKCIERKET